MSGIIILILCANISVSEDTDWSFNKRQEYLLEEETLGFQLWYLYCYRELGNFIIMIG